jgi:hypothetical protein
MTQQGAVPWRTHRVDIAILSVAMLVPIISFAVDFRAGKSDWFTRAGAITTLSCGIVAYRSLSRHYQKFANNTTRGFALETSPTQACIDKATLFGSILGTLIWAYGDKLVLWFMCRS